MNQRILLVSTLGLGLLVTSIMLYFIEGKPIAIPDDASLVLERHFTGFTYGSDYKSEIIEIQIADLNQSDRNALSQLRELPSILGSCQEELADYLVLTISNHTQGKFHRD
ncbi:MAG: hypothetical protein HRU19_13775 [Pseudobacteriovorax sp.]|nr:hypothetical protein [Pseudobacteriovorax sp.]